MGITGRDVVVHTEKVGGVIAALNGHQTFPGVARVGFTYPGRAIVRAEEVDVGGRFSLSESSGKRGNPGFVLPCFSRIHVQGGHVGHDAPLAVGVGGSTGRNTGHSTAQDTDWATFIMALEALM